MDPYLTPSQVARLLEVTTTTIHRWIQQGKLPAHAVGGKRYRVFREDALNMVRPVRPPDVVGRISEDRISYEEVRRRLRREPAL